MTMTEPRPAGIYFRFLALAEASRSVSGLPSLDPLEEQMMHAVVSAGVRNERLSVRDLMGRSVYGSPATIHGRMKAMREKGWIMLSDTNDTRRKQVELTPAALLHFDTLSGCLLQAASGNAQRTVDEGK